MPILTSLPAEPPLRSVSPSECSHLLSGPAANGINSWHNFSLCRFPRTCAHFFFKSRIFLCDSNDKSAKQPGISKSELNMNTRQSVARNRTARMSYYSAKQLLSLLLLEKLRPLHWKTAIKYASPPFKRVSYILYCPSIWCFFF